MRRKRHSLAAAAAVMAAGASSAVWGLAMLARERRARMLHRRTVELLLNVLSAGDPVTARHSRRVADLSYELARAIRMPRRARATLRIAALLHDMGKIDDRFFDIVHSRKPLSEDQRGRIRHHPHESAHILAPLEPHHPGLQEIVESHHECWAGGGYPRGIAGDEIPLGARIIALADAFDAMTQPRKYRGPLPVPDALDELRRGAGKQFDPALVRVVQTRAYPWWAAIATGAENAEHEAHGKRGEPEGRAGDRGGAVSAAERR